MFLADGGGGSASSGPSYTGPQTLRIEPSAIPGALAAFRQAHDKVAKKVSELGGLQIQPWAGDEVSSETAFQFAVRSYGAGDSAIACLFGYEEQLRLACESLQLSHDEYLAKEGSNSELWGKYN